LLGTAGQFALDEVQKRIDLVFVITPSPDPRLGERRISNFRWGDTTWGRRILKCCFDTVEERVDLVFVVAAFSDRWIREDDFADLLCRQPIAGGLAFLDYVLGARLRQLTFQLGDALLRVALIHLRNAVTRMPRPQRNRGPPPFSALLDSPYQAEGVPRRIAEHPEPVLADGPFDPGRAEPPDFSLGSVHVVDNDVEVELLRAAGVRKLRGFVFGRILERQPPTVRICQHHPGIVLGFDGTAENAGVERRQPLRVLTVDHHRTKFSDHEIGIARSRRRLTVRSVLSNTRARCAVTQCPA
jgi:hypothetical protein